LTGWPNAAGASIDVVGAASRGQGLNRLSYAGRWQFVDRTFDGRFHGQSARTFHAGDEVTLFFKGTQLRIFGITGPNGGAARVSFGGDAGDKIVTFFSEKKHAHTVIYSSGFLTSGWRLARLVVLAPNGIHRRECRRVRNIGPGAMSLSCRTTKNHSTSC
jgi:hypothetical protein